MYRLPSLLRWCRLFEQPLSPCASQRASRLCRQDNVGNVPHNGLTLSFAPPQRAWLLGPKRIGPNLLLAPSKKAGSLFDVPPNTVVRAAKATAGKPTVGGQPDGAAAAPAEAEAAADGPAAAAAQPPPTATLDLRLGAPMGALALRWVTGAEAAEDEVGGGMQAMAAAAAEGRTAVLAAEATHGSGGGGGGGAGEGGEGEVPEGLRHVVASVESGVAAGFQIATASGGCSTWMWGMGAWRIVWLESCVAEADAPFWQRPQVGYGHIVVLHSGCCFCALQPCRC